MNTPFSGLSGLPGAATLRPGIVTWMAILFCGGGALSVASGAEPPDRTPPIPLPAVIVTETRDLPPPEQWRYATIPGLEILSEASDAKTQRLLRDLAMFRQALGYAWPMRVGAGETISLIICDGETHFTKFVADANILPDMALASVLLKAGPHTAIVIDAAATELHVNDFGTILDAQSQTDASTIRVDSEQQLRREYVRYLLSRAEPRLPAWFEEGLAQIVMKMDFDARRIDVGRLEDPNTVPAEAYMKAALKSMQLDPRGTSPVRTGMPPMQGQENSDDDDGGPSGGSSIPAEDRDFQAALNGRGLLPLAAIFAVPHNAPETQNPLGGNVWAKESYAFVHMCLYGYKGKYRKPFNAFLQRAAREPVTEAMFRDCFKVSTANMADQLREYCETAVYDWKEFRAKNGEPNLIKDPPPLALRDATEAEIGRLKGGTLLIAGKRDLARIELVAPYVRHHADADLLAALGRFEREDDHAEQAWKLLEAACAAKTKDAEAYLELARMRFANASAQATADGKFGTAQTTAILDLLRAARQLRPPRLETYALMADTWLRSAASPQPEDVFVLAEGVNLFPADLKLTYETAALAGANHQLPIAHSLAEYGITAARDPATKARFEALNASLPPESVAVQPSAK